MKEEEKKDALQNDMAEVKFEKSNNIIKFAGLLDDDEFILLTVN